MNTNNEENINDTQFNNTNSNEMNNLNSTSMSNNSNQNNIMFEQPQTMQRPVGQPLFPEVEEPKKKSKGLLIVVIVIVLVAIGYLVYIKVFKNTANCIEDFKSELSMIYGDELYLEFGDTQYIFDSKFDVDFISEAIEFDEIKLKVCYIDTKKVILFHIGDTTKTKFVDSFELYDKTSNNKLTSTNIDDLVKELGYHSFGKYTEEVTFNKIDSKSHYDMISGKSYIEYDIEIEFSNGKKVNAKYKVSESKSDNKLKVGKKYKIEFEVKEGNFNPIEYSILNIKSI